MAKLFNINDTNGDSEVLGCVQYALRMKFKRQILFGAEFGVAYGGGIEQICTIWKDRGFVWGFDTFEGHPKQLSANANSAEAAVMDGWYQQYGTKNLSWEYIHSELRAKGLKNFRLVKGLIHPHSLDGIPPLHYVLLDLDLLESMKIGFDLIKTHMIKGGYLCVHDIIPREHLSGLHDWWFNEVLKQYPIRPVVEGKYLGVYEV